MTPHGLTADDVLTIPEVAELLKMPTSTVADYVRRGTIPSTQLGRHRRVLRADLERLLHRREG